MSDEQDLPLARAGNQDAFARIYDRHASVVLSLCRRSLSGAPGSLAAAEDAVQEVFVRAYRRLERVESPGQLRAWLYGIARHVCSERRRADRRRSIHEHIAIDRRTTTMIAPPAPTENVDHAEQLDRLGVALDELDDRERLAIHLFYLDTDPVRAAREALGLSRSGYYKLLARARENLGRLMGKVHVS